MTLLYQLSETIEYSKGGDFYKTATLELSPPSMKVFDQSTRLSQLVMRAMMDVKEIADRFKGSESESSGNDQIDGASIKMILLSSKTVSFSEIAEVCKDLFTKVGTYDGTEPLKPAVYEKLKIDDFIMLICDYIANFTFPSLFSGGE